MSTWSKEVFAKNLRMYMDRNGKSQREIAEIVGVSAPTVHDWLKANKYPRIDKIDILADYFGILKSDLIEDKPEDKEKSTAQSDGLTDNQRELIEFVKHVPDESAAMILKVIRSIVEVD